MATKYKDEPLWNSSWNITVLGGEVWSIRNLHFKNECFPKKDNLYYSSFGIVLALPEWEAMITTLLLSIIIVLTIIGNILVILSVFTYKPLRIVQNFFIVSLAVADLTVALLVLPFNVAYSILGRWEFGIHMCKLWLTCDVMCCTSSILNLCAIALDRFWAITDPINYVHKRTVCRVLLQIAGVWITSFLISSPPLIGWNDWPAEFTSTTPCELTSNRGYVIYSSLGSFFIPLVIMTIVYIEIYIATRRRLRERNVTSKMYQLSLKPHNMELPDDNCIVKEKTKHVTSCSILTICSKSPCPEKFGAVLVQRDRDSISSEMRVSSGMNKESYKRETLSKSQPKQRKHIKLENPVEHPDSEISQTSNEFTSPSQKRCRYKVNNFLKSTENNSPVSLELAYTEQEAEQAIQLNHNNDNDNIKETSVDCFISVETKIEEKSTGIYQFIEEKQKISLSKERRAARTLGIIMGVFVFCWLPFFLMYVILPFCNMCCPSQKLKNFITWLGYINSSLNPVIYTIFNLDYRRAFKRLLGINSN